MYTYRVNFGICDGLDSSAGRGIRRVMPEASRLKQCFRQAVLDVKPETLGDIV